MKSSMKIASVLALAVMSGLSASAFADNEHHSSSTVPNSPSAATTVTRLGVTLAPVTVGYTGTGSIQYASSTTGGSVRATVHLPVDGTIIADSNTAVTLAAGNQVVLTVSSGATTLATYYLAASDIDFTYSAATTISAETVEYAVAASENSALVYTLNLGSTTGTTFPALAAGDTVTLTVNGTNVLTGALVANTGH